MSDVNFRVGALYVHPIKSCAAVPVHEALLIETGLEFDRAWMVVDEHGHFLSQRELPRMALIRPTLRAADMVLRAPGMLTLHIAYDTVEGPTRVTVWNDAVPAYDMGDLAAQWFSDFLGRRVRLVRFDPEHKRLSSLEWTGGLEAENQFTDGFPLLVLTRAALDELNTRLAAQGLPAASPERFRPNLVLDAVDETLTAHAEDHLQELQIDTDDGPVRLKLVKPCVRCSIPDVDPVTADTGHAIGDALAGYRADPRMDGGLTFGMNAIVLEGVERLLRVGQLGTGRWAF
ncbi:MAG: MOSC N-terminal beta barrel domain-containing protein [Caldimonas manganoxidans]|nr:MOSC N-terminal beta barrel domain-containing protein [Caldimonas manganoxidans]